MEILASYAISNTLRFRNLEVRHAYYDHFWQTPRRLCLVSFCIGLGVIVSCAQLAPALHPVGAHAAPLPAHPQQYYGACVGLAQLPDGSADQLRLVGLTRPMRINNQRRNVPTPVRPPTTSAALYSPPARPPAAVLRNVRRPRATAQRHCGPAPAERGREGWSLLGAHMCLVGGNQLVLPVSGLPRDAAEGEGAAAFVRPQAPRRLAEPVGPRHRDAECPTGLPFPSSGGSSRSGQPLVAARGDVIGPSRFHTMDDVRAGSIKNVRI